MTASSQAPKMQPANVGSMAAPPSLSEAWSSPWPDHGSETLATVAKLAPGGGWAVASMAPKALAMWGVLGGGVSTLGTVIANVANDMTTTAEQAGKAFIKGAYQTDTMIAGANSLKAAEAVQSLALARTGMGGLASATYQQATTDKIEPVETAFSALQGGATTPYLRPFKNLIEVTTLATAKANVTGLTYLVGTGTTVNFAGKGLHNLAPVLAGMEPKQQEEVQGLGAPAR